MKHRICIVIWGVILSLFSCNNKMGGNVSLYPDQDNPIRTSHKQWKLFEECIDQQHSDQICDSCWYVYVINYKKTTKNEKDK